MAARQVVVHGDGVAGGDEAGGDHAADVAGAAGDEDLHGFIVSRSAGALGRSCRGGRDAPGQAPQVKPPPAGASHAPDDEPLEALVRKDENFCRVLNEPQLGHWRSSFFMKPLDEELEDVAALETDKVVGGHAPSLPGSPDSKATRMVWQRKL